jgi:cytochrome c biogenesis protein CcmG/thiol:disulfide interchange protein DsbE
VRRRAPALLCCCLLALARCGGAQRPERNEPLSLAPEPTARGVTMTLPQLGGGSLSIESYRGHPVLITLFTTWCLRCQAEAPLFVRLSEREEGLRVVGVALDNLTKLSLVQTYVGFVGFRFPVLLAEPTSLELVGGLGQTKQVPRTVLLDAKGALVQDHVGQTDFPRLERALATLLKAR